MQIDEDKKKNLGRPKEDELTPQEILFVDKYVDNFNELEAFQAAKYSSANPKAYAAEVLKRDRVQKAITEKVEEKVKMHGISESSVIAGLLREAQNMGKGSTQTARINAWVWLGKHIGMFNEKTPDKNKGGDTYNIIQYGSLPTNETNNNDNKYKVTKSQMKVIQGEVTKE